MVADLGFGDHRDVAVTSHGARPLLGDVSSGLRAGCRHPDLGAAAHHPSRTAGNRGPVRSPVPTPAALLRQLADFAVTGRDHYLNLRVELQQADADYPRNGIVDAVTSTST